ncbi:MULTISPECIES: CoA transferase [Streptacidiphilus]|uniref:CoA transferase n=1 Tax=Streptacidiphilus cavernicola TaxID=3342716 RepID=A0ABV6UPN1_9ACTN|nr:CoA transferase [Streptacidiphilus jeojiense]
MTCTDDAATVDAWDALGGRAELAAGVSYQGAGNVLPARLPVRELARACVGVCSLAAAELLAGRNGTPVPAVRVNEGAVAAAFVSERHLRIEGRAAVSFAPLSGFWRADDGWVRTHANYPHHRARLLDAVGIPDTGDDQELARTLARTLASRPARSVQEDVYARGGLAVAVARSAEDGAQLLDDRPLVTMHRTSGAGGAAPRVLPPGPLPASGVRVLDLTRVIAGPVSTRTLALLGADVLRVDTPSLREDADAHTDTGMGKRSTLLDLTAAQDRQTFETLLDTADVVVTGYRPGALDRHGLSPAALLERRPGLIVAHLSAWGRSGPWSQRRGFDSLVQAASGIAAIERGDGDGMPGGGSPGVLPAQALDHGTGYLLAAAVLRALTERQLTGSGTELQFSLAGTAAWLVRGIKKTPVPAGDPDPERWLAETDSGYGRLRYALPPVNYEGGPGTWARASTRWGSDLPRWTGTD